MAGPGTFFLTLIILGVMVWPLIKPVDNRSTPSKEEVRKTEPERKPTALPWIMPSLLAAALIVAGFLHYKAAQTSQSSKRENPKSSSPTLSTAFDAPGAAAKDLERVMCKLGSLDLCGIYREHTSGQADMLVAPYIGTWLIEQGLVYDTQMGGDKWHVTAYVKPGEYPMLSCDFGKDDRRIGMLRRNDQVKILGRITSIIATWIYLADCELL